MKNTVQIESIQYLKEYLEEKDTFCFSSKPKKLNHFRILLFALATRDFNPAHIVSDFADKSVFKGVVSHGIGTVSRAEATFVEMVRFKEPVELIAKGYGTIKYYKPMRLGYTYQYDYALSNLKPVKNRWEFDCHVICKTTEPEKQVIAEWVWKTCYVPSPKLSIVERKMLIPKSYFWNVFNYLFFQPVIETTCLVVGGGGVVVGLIILILQLCGIIPATDNSCAGVAL